MSWAILVAKTCQTFPALELTALLRRFFKFYVSWDWSIPVLLTHKFVKHEEWTDVAVQPWSQDFEIDIMSVITPAYPSLNAARSVFRTTKAAIRGEIKRAALMIEQSPASPLDSPAALKAEDKLWADIFRPYHFFQKFGNFLEIRVLSK